MIITNCPRCGAMNATTTCTKCGWSQFTKVTKVSTPIEDALRNRIAELEAEKCVLIDQQREAENHLIDKNLHINSLYEEGYKLQQRIAELKWFIGQLIEAGDAMSNAHSMWVAEEDKWDALVKDWKERER